MSARGGSRAEVFPGGHIGPPLRGVEGVPNQRELAQDESLPQWGGTEPAPYRGPEQADASRPSGAQRSVCGAVARDGWESEQRSSPKCPATPGNPSVTAAPCQLPLHKGAFGTGDADCRVGPAGLLAMTVLILCHSEASAHTGRGNPSFLRWTGVRAAVPRAWPPPAKFRPQHRAAASSAPTKRRDSCRNHPSQRRTAERLRRGHEEQARIAAKAIPKGGPPRDCRGSALSAERAAGQIRFLPDNIRVQHGVQRSEASAKPRPCSRRGCVN